MRAIGIILAGGNSKRLKELSKRRAVCAMPVAGSYRSIDFALSNMEFSRIQKVAVLAQYNSRSLNEHLASSKWWNFGRKQGGLYIFTPSFADADSNWYRGTADAMAQNIQFLKTSHEPYVVIASGDCVYKMDYNNILSYHVDKRADITVVVKEMPEDFNVERYGIVHMDEDNRIQDFVEKPVVAQYNTISCGIYVIRRRLLIELLEKSMDENRYDFVQDILIRYRGLKRIYGYRMEDYWSNIASVEDYYRTNMDFLKAPVRNFFFRQYPEVHSRAADLPPAKYNVGVNIKNSLLSSGCIVNGTVENSILFHQVYVGNNCVIRNSLILNDVYIGDNTIIENCIVESGDTIQANSCYRGTDVRVRRIAREGKMRAVVSITIDNVFVVHDIKVIEGEKGLFIAMPSKKSADGEYRDIAHPINSETRSMLEEIILKSYEESALQGEGAQGENGAAVPTA